MIERMKIDQNFDHVGGNFEWEKEPSCCNMLKAAVDDEKFMFVSNIVGGEEKQNSFYMMPLTSDGYFARSNGIVISHCPWCGSKIDARKKYSKK